MLQTDPYLSFVRPGSPCPVVYSTDEETPVTPKTSVVGDPAFGIIGLDRRIVWSDDARHADALKFAAPRPVASAVLCRKYGANIVAELRHRGWLQEPETLCCDYMITTAQIEVTAHCNWACRCCPVSQHEKPSATMSMLLYNAIIEKLRVVKTLRYITHHFYNEPSLDRHFVDRLLTLQGAGLRIRLFTNGSGLSETKIKALAETGVLDFVVFNLPSTDQEVFTAFTGSKSYGTSYRNLEIALDYGLSVRIAVNGPDVDVARTIAVLNDRYGARGVKVFASLISDRAAALDNEFRNGVSISGPLTGCSWPVNHLHIGVEGEFFLCCNDYFKREVFGHIDDGSIHRIMSSQAAVTLRRKIFGVTDASRDFICRKCHDQCPTFPLKQFKPIAQFPLRLSKLEVVRT
jgi:hypothetical protein